MGRKSQSRRSRLEQRKKPVPFIRRREVRYGLGIAAGFAVLTAILFLSNRSLWLAPERIVTIYRVHGCRCAFPWKRELERKGFSVVMNEVESLQFIRQRLRTPTEARGCHVGEYLGYFVEGHVHPTALDELSRRRPAPLRRAGLGGVGAPHLRPPPAAGVRPRGPAPQRGGAWGPGGLPAPEGRGGVWSARPPPLTGPHARVPSAASPVRPRLRGSGRSRVRNRRGPATP